MYFMSKNTLGVVFFIKKVYTINRIEDYMTKKKKKIKYKNILLILLVIGLIIFLVNKPSKEVKEEKFDFTNKTKEEVLAYSKEKKNRSNRRI